MIPQIQTRWGNGSLIWTCLNYGMQVSTEANDFYPQSALQKNHKHQYLIYGA